MPTGPGGSPRSQALPHTALRKQFCLCAFDFVLLSEKRKQSMKRGWGEKQYVPLLQLALLKCVFLGNGEHVSIRHPRDRIGIMTQGSG